MCIKWNVHEKLFNDNTIITLRVDNRDRYQPISYLSFAIQRHMVCTNNDAINMSVFTCTRTKYETYKHNIDHVPIQTGASTNNIEELRSLIRTQCTVTASNYINNVITGDIIALQFSTTCDTLSLWLSQASIEAMLKNCNYSLIILK